MLLIKAISLCFMFSSTYGASNSFESVIFLQVEQEIMDWDAPEYLKTKYPYYLSGHDHDGSPVFVAEMGKWNSRYAVGAGPEIVAELDKWMTLMLLCWRTAANEAVGSPGTVGIVDIEGFDITQVCNIGATAKTIPQNAAGCTASRYWEIYTVNANYLFERVLEIGTPLLGEAANFFEFYGTNSVKWKPVLLKAIPAEELPAWYGGSKSHQAIKIFG